MVETKESLGVTGGTELQTYNLIEMSIRERERERERERICTRIGFYFILFFLIGGVVN